MFEPGVAYPSDGDGGPYVEDTGEVIAVAGLRITVQTEQYGEQYGYAHELYEGRPGALPRVGDTATIRLYNSGGGWYPDDRIVSWSRA